MAKGTTELCEVCQEEYHPDDLMHGACTDCTFASYQEHKARVEELETIIVRLAHLTPDHRINDIRELVRDARIALRGTGKLADGS